MRQQFFLFIERRRENIYNSLPSIAKNTKAMEGIARKRGEGLQFDRQNMQKRWQKAIIKFAEEVKQVDCSFYSPKKVATGVRLST